LRKILTGDPRPGDLEVRFAAHLLLERSLRAYVTTAGISWDRLLSIRIQRESNEASLPSEVS
jgi:hypothetical protein